MESPPEYSEVDPNKSMMTDQFIVLHQYQHMDIHELLSGKRKRVCPRKQERCNRTAGSLAVFVLLLLALPVIVVPLLERGLAAKNLERGKSQSTDQSPKCQDQCRVSLVESIPQNLTYSPGSPSHPSIYSGWKSLIQSARYSIDLGVFYWTLRGVDVYEDPSSWQGEEIFNELLNAVSKRGIKVRIAQNKPQDGQSTKDSEILAEAGAQVRTLDFDRFLGAGILHTKLWIVDGQHFYVGSANMDWRSLTQVKELGTVSYNCSCLAEDIQKIFDVYWYMGSPNSMLPASWPSDWSTQYNNATPMQLSINNIQATTYLSSSPPEFCPSGRTVDIDAILDIIAKAQSFIYIAVMEYFPTTLYTKPRRFWPVIDDALRRASLERGVEVRLMPSHWIHSEIDLPKYLKSLTDLSGALRTNISAKLFVVPAFTKAQSKIPFARVNHNKYMVTDNTAYIGTSNWSGDYFINTGGIGYIINQTDQSGPSNADTVQVQLRDIFLRDWNSEFAHPISDFLEK